VNKDSATRLLPARPGESDDERRLREAVNRLGGQLMAALDAAIAMRSAPPEAQRQRHVARGSLVNFGSAALLALAFKNDAENQSRTDP
jgi:hypothetical protein